MTLLMALPAHAAPLDSFRDCADCPEMVELPLGEFVMGAAPNEFRRMLALGENAASGNPKNPYLKLDEGPLQLVKVDVRFAIGRNEVTYEEWMACVNDGGCNGYVPADFVFRGGPDPSKIRVIGRFPVLHVSYWDALTYVEWLNKKTGTAAYRLPTEAEWEYAARAGTQTTFPTGETITSDQANFSKQLTQFVMLKEMPELNDREAPVSVDDLDAANAWGLRHMVGNAMELTGTCYSDRLPDLHLTSAWRSAVREDCAERVVRGGSWMSPVDLVRSAWRGSTEPQRRSGSRGFRIIKELD